jgi:hypothetical protein
LHLSGIKNSKLGSIEDRTRIAVYYRREQLRVFETLIGVYSSAMISFPEMRQSVLNMVEDYFEIVVPGSKQVRKEDERNFVEKQSKALENIAALLADHAGKRKEDTLNAGQGQTRRDQQPANPTGPKDGDDIRASGAAAEKLHTGTSGKPSILRRASQDAAKRNSPDKA